MKLKKLMALALSGVLAVSMFAGCAEGGNSNGDKEPVNETGIVSAVNEALANNKIDTLTFTAGDASQLESALKAAGEKATDGEVRAKLVDVVKDSKEIYYANNGSVLNPDLQKDGETETNVGVNVFKVDENLTEEASVKKLASDIVNSISNLKKSNVVTGTTTVGGSLPNFV